MNDIEALRAEILRETEKLAAEYARRFSGDPEGELRAWLHIAARREAMVRDVYGEAERSYRLPEPHTPAGEVAWEAVTLIWQHEEVHTRFIEVRLKDGIFKERSLSAELMIWLGTMEGKFLAALTGPPGLRQLFSKLALRLGALFTPEQVPAFTLALSEMKPREFFLLCSALETTAHQSYARMETLAGSLADQAARDARPSPQLENLARELRLKTLDEKFHEAAFEEMAGWVNDGHLDPTRVNDGHSDPRWVARECAQRLATLLPRGDRATREHGRMHVMTDGGLGVLFRKQGISITVD